MGVAIALVAVPWYGIAQGYHWSAWLGFALFLAANGFSITAGYHRLWSHNAYKAHPVVRVALAEGFRGHAQSVLTRFEGE